MAEENLSPISAPKPPAVNPLSPSPAAHAATLKLKPVVRPSPGGAGKSGARPILKPGGGVKPILKPALKPAIKPAGGAPAAVASKPEVVRTPAAPVHAPSSPSETGSMLQLKSVTQKLKGVTQQIPQQAILHKTGIIADQNLTDAQKQASKSRTSRISLSDAIGVAPVQNEAAPMKTIRIKRPVDLPSAPAAPAKPSAEAAPEEDSVTQRKTLKVSRPGASGVRPSGKFTVKKPGAAAPAKTENADDGEVADIADIPETPAALPATATAQGDDNRISDVPAGLAVFDLILQIAACIGIGFLGYLLYTDYTMQWF